MNPWKYLIVFDDFSLQVVDRLDDDLVKSAHDGDIVIVRVKGAQRFNEMTFIESRNVNDYGWSDVNDSKNSD